MKKLIISLSIIVFGAMIAFAAVPTNHNVDNGGVMHKPGGDNPTKNCGTKKCHGTDLSGGKAKKGCTDCHGEYW